MSVPGFAPPPFFLATPGRPPLPWEQWEQLFNVYLVASGAAEFTPARRKAILLHCLGPEGQRSTAAAPPVPSAAALAVKDGDHYGTTFRRPATLSSSVIVFTAAVNTQATAFWDAVAIFWGTAAANLSSTPFRAADPKAPATSLASRLSDQLLVTV
ncbi:hypothetical protein HPB52_024495 [Rhipicephalus sanguineus]|uniref:Uncharacterized protein n=1 Tax=Rhipicephalus sanguineus TaxID=34632 RepID=A0A9D4YR01_RHISA|nr:hypothetical protein HPB52_024495 [Rhipicephalus sanguineus]